VYEQSELISNRVSPQKSPKLRSPAKHPLFAESRPDNVAQSGKRQFRDESGLELFGHQWSSKHYLRLRSYNTQQTHISPDTMFECRSCALRCMRAIAGDATSARQPLQHGLLLTPQLQQRPSRRAASTSTAQEFGAGDAFDDVIEYDEVPKAPERAVVTPRAHQLTKRAKGVEIENKKLLEIELRWLKDPLKLSEHVKYTLKCDKPEKALDLCRMASKTMSCVVSWNAVIDWMMRNKKINEAIKLYNEMKKRAQFPDSYTYMMVLRGLGFKSHVGQPVKEENVSKAIAIYTSMNSPTSRVKPNIMHTNATLNVCALAMDMDALWSVAAQIPVKGPQAADRMTYTIILNAIRHSAYGKNPEDVPLEQVASRRQKAVDEGRRVWIDIVRKWRSGEIMIDEDLVGSMGRLLLTSKRIEDWDNVLDLVQQTMNVKRLIEPVGSAQRHTEHVPQEPAEQAPEAPEEEVDEEGYSQSPATQAFKVVKPSQPEHATSKGTRPLVWAQPGPQTVSLLVDACQRMRIPRVASAYWELLTNGEHSVTPDLENFDRQLRLFASNRASAKAAKLISEDLPAAGIEPKHSTFRLAMSACQRDMKNPHVLEHATTIIDVMEKTHPDPDSQTLMEYLSLALTSNDGPKIIAVINRMDSIVHNLRSRISYGPDRKISEVADVRDLKQACLFLQTLVGTIDTLMSRSLVPQEEFQHWHARRADLMKFLGTAKRRVEKRDRNLAPPPEGNKRLGKPLGLMMGKDAWAMRKFRYDDPNRKELRRENVRQDRDSHFNPPRRDDGAGRGGFGM
jgi:pentatricopeptide repeat protein